MPDRTLSERLAEHGLVIRKGNTGRRVVSHDVEPGIMRHLAYLEAPTPGAVDWEIENLLRAIEYGRKLEREACADIADQHNSCEGIAQAIASVIRQRGDK